MILIQRIFWIQENRKKKKKITSISKSSTYNKLQHQNGSTTQDFLAFITTVQPYKEIKSITLSSL